ncbi:hypothetical protein [Parendozoicomonas sp. Alg238-R29]|uniref:hypothetical protein n=1 Tax=Parendozoicomonas sp. Alg238-R29 TaxID=2993446 RepID=UPI00248D5056|nr:hypothetical protein [Parendozoicomonas sp. Alg238-R29]
MSVTLSALKDLAMYELKALSPQELMALMSESEKALHDAQYQVKWLQSALAQKYMHRADNLRKLEWQKTGSITFEDDGVLVEQDVPVIPSWDQDHLAFIAETMQRCGGNPAEYMQITYSIDESKFDQWPEAFQRQIAEARCTEKGAVVYRLISLEEGGGQ